MENEDLYSAGSWHIALPVFPQRRCEPALKLDMKNLNISPNEWM